MPCGVVALQTFAGQVHIVKEQKRFIWCLFVTSGNRASTMNGSSPTPFD